MFTVLENFGLGPQFIAFIKLLYASPIAKVQTNSTLSQPFALGRGTRQGCPLSPILFDLAIEPLAIALRNCQGIYGIWRGGAEHRVSLYADDLLLYVSDPNTSLPAALSLLEQFGSISGYKINMHKSELFPLNKEAFNLDYSGIPFQIQEKQFTYLGVVVTRHFKNLLKENFIALLNRISESQNSQNIIITVVPSHSNACWEDKLHKN